MWKGLFRTIRNLPARRLFDSPFYLARYPDVAAAGAHPLRHYLKFGMCEGRKPHPLFDPDYYLRRNPSARGTQSPVLHFLRTGGPAGMSPHPLFDIEAYLASSQDSRGQNPLVHFSRHPKPAVTEGSQFGCAS